METASKTPGEELPLIDRFGRHVTYLRMSVTDRCNFRCVYCMDPDTRFVPRAQILTLEELLRLGQVFVALGVSKIRITGGEPLMRRNLPWLLRELANLSGLRELVLTTNGSRLEQMAQEIRAAGVKRLNISLDTLHPERFKQIARSDRLGTVLRGIDAALDAGFERIKLNAVIVKGHNHDEVRNLMDFAVHRGMDISFIEEMPVGPVDDHDRGNAYYSSERIRRDLSPDYPLTPVHETSDGPASYFRSPGNGTRVGFISPRSHNFCASCNRVRMTVEGRMLLCLGQEDSVDLRGILRNRQRDDAALKQAIREAIQLKPKGHDFDLTAQPVAFRHMNLTGG